MDQRMKHCLPALVWTQEESFAVVQRAEETGVSESSCGTGQGSNFSSMPQQGATPLQLNWKTKHSFQPRVDFRQVKTP